MTNADFHLVIADCKMNGIAAQSEWQKLTGAGTRSTAVGGRGFFAVNFERIFSSLIGLEFIYII